MRFFKILRFERNSLKIAHFLKFNFSRIYKSHVHDVKISSIIMPDINHPKCGANMQRRYKRGVSLCANWLGVDRLRFI